ncbi:hypothetical protein [Aquimarina muelleri]|uniref:Secreted protein n=1 Tax=Aquimarina muelleri TaxID=279356 RepID=A0A918JSQ4_9FLAO|nr:hypothetical protein [Aquimarina muelleri]MCX2762384.1 hypothetical protein [Aquimarina muelleri]GGX03883.1 hypothetical protein GCM10007384_02060 [Aquimarina muelleri]
MKAKLFFFFLLCLGNIIYAQIENNSSLRINNGSELKTSNFNLSKGLSSPNLNSPLYTPPKELTEYGQRTSTIDMTGETDFLKPEFEATPKSFKTEKEIKEEFKKDQYLGGFKSSGKFVQLIYRDHGAIDGDVVRIFLNDDIINGRVYLTGSYQTTKITLLKGFNTIDILALNNGDAAPNTAEFHLYDDQGNLITGNEWNLIAGVKATLVVVKD